MKKITLLASLLSVSLMAADADYQTQHDSADKAFNEMEGKENSDKDLELQKKDLEIERLKLELEKKKLAEEKQKSQQPAPSYQATPSYQSPRQTVPTSSFYLGFETYNASGKQTTTYESDDYPAIDGQENEEESKYTQNRIVIGFGRVNENRFEIGFSSGRTFTGDSGFNDIIEEGGTGLDLTWNIVASSMYNAQASTNVLPFFKIGFGYGVYELTDEFTTYYNSNETQIVAFDFKLGLGAYVQLNKNIEFSAAYDYTGMAFQPIEYYYGSASITEKNSAAFSGLSLGFNFHF